jgi:hypothetical protein
MCTAGTDLYYLPVYRMCTAGTDLYYLPVYRICTAGTDLYYLPVYRMCTAGTDLYYLPVYRMAPRLLDRQKAAAAYLEGQRAPIPDDSDHLLVCGRLHKKPTHLKQTQPLFNVSKKDPLAVN